MFSALFSPFVPVVISSTDLSFLLLCFDVFGMRLCFSPSCLNYQHVAENQTCSTLTIYMPWKIQNAICPFISYFIAIVRNEWVTREQKKRIASTHFVYMNSAFINVSANNSGSLSHNSIELVIGFSFFLLLSSIRSSDCSNTHLRYHFNSLNYGIPITRKKRKKHTHVHFQIIKLNGQRHSNC